MPSFVLLSTLTTKGRETLHTHPERVLGVNEEIDTFGCQVRQQWALLGPYDFLTVIEAPDAETVAHLSVDLGSRGTVNITTYPALELDGFLDKLHSSEQLAAKPVVEES